jgi:class 3 adenylate cyclase
MRALLLGDIVAAARALRAVDVSERPALLARLLEEASEAAHHGRQTGRNHPLHGDGSLMSAALAHGCVPEPALEDPQYRQCLALVLEAALPTEAGSQQALAPRLMPSRLSS